MNTFTPIALALTVGMATSAAHAQGTLTFSHQKAEAGALYQQGLSYFGNTGITQSFAGSDFVGIQSRSHAVPTFSGKGFSHHGATFLTPGSVVGAPFTGAVLDACTSAEIFNSSIGPHPYEEAYGMANGIIEFTLSAPMDWTWIGGWQGRSFNTGSYNEVLAVHELIDLGTGFNHVNQSRSSLNGSGDWVEFFSRGGRLGAGHYRLTWSHESYVLGGNTFAGFYPTGFGGAPLVSCINSTFQLYPIPAPGPLATLALGGLVAARRRR